MVDQLFPYGEASFVAHVYACEFVDHFDSMKRYLLVLEHIEICKCHQPTDGLTRVLEMLTHLKRKHQM